MFQESDARRLLSTNLDVTWCVQRKPIDDRDSYREQVCHIVQKPSETIQQSPFESICLIKPSPNEYICAADRHRFIICLFAHHQSRYLPSAKEVRLGRQRLQLSAASE